MAKKRTIDPENAEPLRDLPSSGIQVNYKHQTIIASDETSEYALLTKDKVCEANIGVTYIKPAESDKFPFIIPINFDPDSPLSGTVAFTSDKSADAMLALRAGRPICVQLVGQETNLVPISYMTCLNSADNSDTDPAHWNIIALARANLSSSSEGAVIWFAVMDINLRTNTWTSSRAFFN
jgi:hypothetical protein